MLFNPTSLLPEEKIITIIRKHKIYYFKHLLVLIFLIPLPPIIYLITYFYLQGIENQIINLLFFLFYSIYLLITLLLSYISWMNYYFDVWIITNKRIIAFEQKSLFHRETSELNIKTIQDITVNIQGIVASLFHFGTIYIQTAGATEKFIFKDAPDPDKTKDIIMSFYH